MNLRDFIPQVKLSKVLSAAILTTLYFLIYVAIDHYWLGTPRYTTGSFLAPYILGYVTAITWSDLD